MFFNGVTFGAPSIPMTKPELVKALRERGLVFAGLGGGVEDAAAKPALASMLATIWVNEYDDERDARFINDRVHDNIQKGGTMLVCPRHDRTFDLRTGESLTSDCQLRTYPVRVAEDGRIMLERIAVSAE